MQSWKIPSDSKVLLHLIHKNEFGLMVGSLYFSHECRIWCTICYWPTRVEGSIITTEFSSPCMNYTHPFNQWYSIYISVTVVSTQPCVCYTHQQSTGRVPKKLQVLILRPFFSSTIIASMFPNCKCPTSEIPCSLYMRQQQSGWSVPRLVYFICILCHYKWKIKTIANTLFGSKGGCFV